MATYYHGTSERNARAIEIEGFQGSDPSEFTDGFNHCANGVIFLATTQEHAAGYGGVVFEIETDDAIFFGECPVTGLPEYAVNINSDFNFSRI